MKKLFAVLVAALAFSAGMPAANLAPVPSTVETITPEELRMHLEFLASDELGGRYTLAPNFAISARYLASHLKSYGFHGAAKNGDFLQYFDVISSHPDASRTALALTVNGKTTNYELGDIYTFNSFVSGTASGQVVFVGEGVSSPAQKHDDYAGLDVKGKIVLIAGGTPEGVDSSRLTDAEEGDGAAAAHGAAGVLSIPSRRFALFINDKSLKDRILGRDNVRLSGGNDGNLPRLTLTKDVADKLLAPAGLSVKAIYEAEKEHRPLKPAALEASARIAVAFQERRVRTQNVVGVLEGTDPKLKNEYVAFSAHYDHLQTANNGDVFHGADDDGSGTVAILAIARAMAKDPPRRSILIIFHAGEELGLLGSEYNTDIAPAVPLDKMVADLNIDMIGRSKPAGDQAEADVHLTDARTVYLVGSNRISQELHQLSEATNDEFQKLRLDYHYNDPNNPERIYFRSDHWNYAKHGVPVIFYFDGTHVDYHKTTDTVDKIDFNKMTNITRLVFETGWRIANLDHRLEKAVGK
ncbi:MAG: M28 family peptidase [Acidobacteriia bacterium]|nr:M28 family peptidase [Terriglobia bacterium]